MNFNILRSISADQNGVKYSAILYVAVHCPGTTATHASSGHLVNYSVFGGQPQHTQLYYEVRRVFIFPSTHPVYIFVFHFNFDVRRVFIFPTTIDIKYWQEACRNRISSRHMEFVNCINPPPHPVNTITFQSYAIGQL